MAGKKELAKRIVEIFDVSYENAEWRVEVVTKAIQSLLLEGENVKLKDIGTITVGKRYAKRKNTVNPISLGIRTSSVLLKMLNK